jgi:hypothetical protein
MAEAFNVVAERDGVEIGRLRLLASCEEEARNDSLSPFAKGQAFDIFDKTVTIRVERAHA